MILNTHSMAEWEAIRRRKQQLIDKNNQNENKNCKPHIYEIHGKVLVRNKNTNKDEEPHKRPYQITNVWINRNVTIHRGAVQYCMNIIWIKPYHK